MVEYTALAIKQVLEGDMIAARDSAKIAIEQERSECDAYYIHAVAQESEASLSDLLQMERNIISFGDHLNPANFFNLTSKRPYIYLPDLYLPGVEYPFEFYDQQTIFAAYSLALIKNKDYREANAYIRKHFHSQTEFPNCILWAAFYFAVEDWPNLIKITPTLRRSQDSSRQYLGIFWYGVGNARLGLLQIGEETLTELVNDPQVPQYLKVAASIELGMIYRALNHEGLSDKHFENAYKIKPSREILAIKDNPDLPFETTTAKHIALREDYFDPHSVSKHTEAVSLQIVEARQDLLEEAMTDLHSQIGIWSVKKSVEILQAKILLSQRRKNAGLLTSSSTYHLALTGPPGTGKTTIARILAKLFYALGLLPSDRILEVGRKDLVGEFLGSSAIKTQAVLDKALGGVLYIDEAYMLAQTGYSGGDAYGREAVDTILTFMDDHRDEMVLIVSGYADEIDRLMEVNPGLRSRIPKSIEFSTYTPDELVRIGESMCEKRDSKLSPEAKRALAAAAEEKAKKFDVTGRSMLDLAGNGRWIRNIVEAAEDLRDFRLVPYPDVNQEEMMTIIDKDIIGAISDLEKKNFVPR